MITLVFISAIILILVILLSQSTSSNDVGLYNIFLVNFNWTTTSKFPKLEWSKNDGEITYFESPIFRVTETIALLINDGVLYCTFNTKKNWTLNKNSRGYPNVVNAFNRAKNGEWIPIIYDKNIVSIDADHGELQYLDSSGNLRYLSIHDSYDSIKDGKYKTDKLIFDPSMRSIYNGFVYNTLDWGFSRRFFYGREKLMSNKGDTGYGRGIKMSYELKNNGKTLKFHDIATNYFVQPFSKNPIDARFLLTTPCETNMCTIALGGYYSDCMLLLLCCKIERVEGKYEKKFGFYTCAIDTDHLDYTPHFRPTRFLSSLPGDNSAMVWIWHELPTSLTNLSSLFRIRPNENSIPDGSMTIMISDSIGNGYWEKKIGNIIGDKYVGDSDVVKWNYVGGVYSVEPIIKIYGYIPSLYNYITSRENKIVFDEDLFTVRDMRGVYFNSSRNRHVSEIKNWGDGSYVSEVLIEGVSEKVFIFKHINWKSLVYGSPRYEYYMIREGEKLESNREINVHKLNGSILIDVGRGEFFQFFQ